MTSTPPRRARAIAIAAAVDEQIRLRARISLLATLGISLAMVLFLTAIFA